MNRGELVKGQSGADALHAGIDHFQLQFLSPLHFADQTWIGDVGSDAGVGQAPDVGNRVGLAFVDGELDAGSKVHSDRDEDLHPRLSFTFALDQIGTNRGLAGVKIAGDAGAANLVGAGRLEAEFLPISIFDLARQTALSACDDFR